MLCFKISKCIFLFQPEVEPIQINESKPSEEAATGDDVMSLLQKHERKTNKNKQSDSDSDSSGEEIIKKFEQSKSAFNFMAPISRSGKILLI